MVLNHPHFYIKITLLLQTKSFGGVFQFSQWRSGGAKSLQNEQRDDIV